MTQPKRIEADSTASLTMQMAALIELWFESKVSPRVEITYNVVESLYKAHCFPGTLPKSGKKLVFTIGTDMELYEIAGAAKCHGVLEGPMGSLYWSIR